MKTVYISNNDWHNIFRKIFAREELRTFSITSKIYKVFRQSYHGKDELKLIAVFSVTNQMDQILELFK